MDFSAIQSMIFRSVTTEKNSGKHFTPVTDSGFNSLEDVEDSLQPEPESSIEAEEYVYSLTDPKEGSGITSKKLNAAIPNNNKTSTTLPTNEQSIKDKLNLHKSYVCERIPVIVNKLPNTQKYIGERKISSVCSVTPANCDRIQQKRSINNDYKRQQNIKRLFQYWKDLKDKHKAESRSNGFMAVKCQMKKFMDLQIKINTVTKDNLILEKQLGLVSQDFQRVEVALDSLVENISNLNHKR